MKVAGFVTNQFGKRHMVAEYKDKNYLTKCGCNSDFLTNENIAFSPDPLDQDTLITADGDLEQCPICRYYRWITL